MLAGEIVALFRNEVMDTEMPYLWSQDEAFIYLNDAYTMLVRFLGGVSDASTPAVAQIAFSANTKSVNLHSSVLRIVRAFNNAGEEISVIEDTDFPLVRNASGKLALLRVGSTSAADIEYLVMGADHRKALLHPVPNTSGTITLHVRRVPVTPLDSDTDTLPDLQPEHHMHLVKWMKALAYRKQDAETFDMDKALLNETSFLQYASQAVYEVSRFNRKSKNSLRSNQDIRNPMLQASAARMYQPSVPAPERQRPEGE